MVTFLLGMAVTLAIVYAPAIRQSGVAILDAILPPMVQPETPTDRDLGWVLRQYNEQRRFHPCGHY